MLENQSTYLSEEGGIVRCSLNDSGLERGNSALISCQATVRSQPLSLADDVYQAYLICGAIIIAICILGTLSNGLNVFVLARVIRRPSASPTYHLLLAMGVADLMAILFYSIYAVVMFARQKPLLFGDLTEDHSDFIHILMRSWYFPVNIFLLASNWCVVAVTIFRFLAVTFPMKVCRWCTLVRVRMSIIIIFALSLILNIPDWLTVTFEVRSDGHIRGNDTELYHHMAHFYLIYQGIEILIPFVINLILVVALIRNLYLTRFSMASAIQDDTAAARQREHRRIGIMLVLIVVWFLFCYAPKLIVNLIRELGPMARREIESHPDYMKAGIAADIFLLANHAGNVIFYCLCNKNYRMMFLMTLFCRKSMNAGTQYGSRYTTRTAFVGTNSCNSKIYIQKYLLQPLHHAPQQ